MHYREMTSSSECPEPTHRGDSTPSSRTTSALNFNRQSHPHELNVGAKIQNIGAIKSLNGNCFPAERSQGPIWLVRTLGDREE